MVKKFRKKPVVVEAMLWDGSINTRFDILCWLGFTPAKWIKKKNWIEIETLEGKVCADVGDYIIKGVKGEFYPCKPDIFEMTYEKINNE